MAKKANVCKVLAVLLITSGLSVFSVDLASASCNTSTDRFGNTTGYCDGQRVSTSTDRFGNTTGSIGNSRVSTSTDRFGNQTGSIGNKRISCSTDRFGNKRC